MNTYAEIAETTPYYSPMPYGKQPATNAGGTSALGYEPNELPAAPPRDI